MAVCLFQTSAYAGGGSGHRLFYLYDPQVEDHAALAQQLEAMVEPYRDVLEIVRIARAEAPGAAIVPAEPREPAPYDIQTADRVLSSTQLSSGAKDWLLTVLPRQGDFFALDSSAGLEYSGVGGELRDGVAAFLRLLGAGAVTEVDFSTWGKVKDLFK